MVKADIWVISNVFSFVQSYYLSGKDTSAFNSSEDLLFQIFN